MKLANPDRWAVLLAANTDPYGAATLAYAEGWADLMEQRMAGGPDGGAAMDGGAPLEDVAKQASYDANTDGITGAMYGMAASILAECWEHGERLRKWHNLDVQIGTEGERANADGGTLNPAFIEIETSGGRRPRPR